MEYLSASLFAAIQAVTEFVPVSSSGHLVLLHAAFPAVADNELAFDVMLHGATLFATAAFFWREIGAILRALWAQVARGVPSAEARLGWLLVLGSVPAAIVGLVAEDYIERTLRSPWVVVGMLIAIAVGMLAVERRGADARADEFAVTARAALLIGCAQALALVPGTSRSGITIIAGMALGLKREAALRFSFLLSLPIIFGATVKKLPEVVSGSGGFGGELVVAFAVAAVGGFVVIKYLLRYVRNHSLAAFAYYRLALAAVTAAVLLW